jgi:hypothetical protein
MINFSTDAHLARLFFAPCTEREKLNLSSEKNNGENAEKKIIEASRSNKKGAKFNLFRTRLTTSKDFFATS